MSKTRKVETDRFEALAEDGSKFTIVEVTSQTGFTPLATGVTKWADGLKEYQVTSGGFANRISEAVFQIVSNNKIVKRV
ncbi:hypothetical protein, partial [Pseudomonas syringae]|uniref:hypothetical protein n=1 Tax=Pseudomonas syringae TaxID=317 RepID=UPI00035508A5